jgi:phytol kinase
MDADAGSNAGTVWFPLSFTVLILSLWGVDGGKAATCAGLLALAWGDAAAALIGRRWGRHRYRAGESWRSLEGSAGMLAFSLLGIVAAGTAVASATGGRPYDPLRVAAGAAAATLFEAAGRRGSDNFLVPVGTALLLWGLGLVIPIG